MSASPVRTDLTQSAQMVRLIMGNPRLRFSRKRRLLSLDVFRGLSVLLMIFVNSIGGSWPYLSTSPWDGILLGDLIEPFFLLTLGVSVTLSMKTKTKTKTNAFIYGIKRFLKLFIIGIFIEGGINITTYNLKYIRIMGVLQRISICYLFAIILELVLQPLFSFGSSLTPTNSYNDFSQFINSNKSKNDILSSIGTKSDNDLSSSIQNTCNNKILFVKHKGSPPSLGPVSTEHDLEGWSRRYTQSFSVYRMYQYHWLIFIILLSVYCFIIYGIYTPDVPYTSTKQCGYGVLNPSCNSVSYLDSKIFGIDHMYFPINSDDISFQRMDDCSSCSPGRCLKQQLNITNKWCYIAPFEPKSIITTSTTSFLTTMFGMHIGHLLLNFGEKKVRILHLFTVSFFQCVVGILLHYSEINIMNASLYSISYLFISSGIATLILCILYWIMDIKIYKYRSAKKYKKRKKYHAAKSHLNNYRAPMIADLNNKNNKVVVSSIEEEEELQDQSQSSKSSVDDEDKKQDDLFEPDFSEQLDRKCPFWCCCCCENLPCLRWDWKCINILDKLIFKPLESLGRNAFIIYILSVSGVINWLFSRIYWEIEDKCLANILWPTGVYWGPNNQNAARTWEYSIEIMLWTILYCIVWTTIAIRLYNSNWFYVI